MKNKLVLSVAVAAAVALLAFFAISKAAPATDCPSTTPVDCSGFVQCTGSHQPLPISSDQAPQGTEEDCRNTNLCAGQVLWHFVLTSPQNTSGILKVSFTNAGEFCVDSYTQGGSGNLFWAVITSGPDTLNAFSTDACGNNLNLSHVCGNSARRPRPPRRPPTLSPPVSSTTPTATASMTVSRP